MERRLKALKAQKNISEKMLEIDSFIEIHYQYVCSINSEVDKNDVRLFHVYDTFIISTVESFLFDVFSLKKLE